MEIAPEHVIGDPLRFSVGTRVEVCLNLTEGGPLHGLISVTRSEGGEWTPAIIIQHNYRQDDWCPDFICAYSVIVDDELWPVREDDERCIRRLLETGMRVTLKNLQSRADLNGKTASITRCMGGGVRYGVKITDSGVTIAVKRENLFEIIDDDGSVSRSDLEKPITVAAQFQHHDQLAILVMKALEQGRPELLESPDPEQGRSPAYLAVQKGNPLCLGVMAKAGANLHRACPHVWQLPGENGLVDPDEECFPVHHALNQTVISFTNRTCLACTKNHLEAPLKCCVQCKMAYFCSVACQKEKWSEHKKVCKKIRKGADLVTFHDGMPKQAVVDEGGFLPFEECDHDLELELDEDEREEDYYDASICWEYYDLGTQKWTPYPKCTNRDIEGMREMGMSERYMYKPGNKDAEGMEERKMSANPPASVATNHVYYCHMIDHHIYTGCGRRIRRRVIG